MVRAGCDDNRYPAMARYRSRIQTAVPGLDDGCSRKMVGIQAKPLVRIRVALCAWWTGNNFSRSRGQPFSARKQEVCFLAFPAIFCASATLIEKHERERKQELGLSGYRRGTDAAALDAAGAGLGSIGLAAFGLGVWLLAPTLAFGSLALGAVGWLLASVLLWRLRREARIIK